jgi:hypothetical protein
MISIFICTSSYTVLNVSSKAFSFILVNSYAVETPLMHLSLVFLDLSSFFDDGLYSI